MAGRLARIRSKADNALDGGRYSETDSSEDEAMRAVPRGCLGKAGVALVAQAKAGENEYRPRRPRLVGRRSRRRCHTNSPQTGRGDAAGATRIVRGRVAARRVPRG